MHPQKREKSERSSNTYIEGKEGERVLDQEAHQTLRIEDELIPVGVLVPGRSRILSLLVEGDSGG